MSKWQMEGLRKWGRLSSRLGSGLAMRHLSGIQKSGFQFLAEIPRPKLGASITFHDFGATGSKIIVI